MDNAAQNNVADQFYGILKPTVRPLWMPSYSHVSLLVKDSFTLTTLFSLGALMQCVLFLTLPSKYAILPASVLALKAMASTITKSRSDKSNTYLGGIVPGRTTAQFPDPATGIIPAVAASKPLVVFHLGVRFNHPLGLLSPGGREMGQFFKDMNNDLHQRASEYGVYHMSHWTGTSDPRNNTLLTVYYFRDVEGLHKFAHNPIHRKGWDWYNTIKNQYKHIGIFHETFVTGPQQYETIYGNMKPTLLGAASIECKSEEVQDRVWVNTLVSADVGPLRGMMRRMGKMDATLAPYA
ncbi:hypothetical protein EsH8_I_000122 [Colletotrichum jinshuiense]